MGKGERTEGERAVGLLWLAAAAWVGNALYAMGAPGGALKFYSPALVAVAMIAFVILHGCQRYGATVLWRFTIIVFAIAWIFETFSVLTGFPFGRYHYTEVMAPFLWHVPVFVLPAYALMAYASWTLATLLLGHLSARPIGRALWAVPVVAAGAMVAWDLSMDILRSTVEQRWIWMDGGPYFGIPISNYLGWFGVTWLMFQGFALYLRRQPEDSLPMPPVSRRFWLSVPLIYAGFAGEYLLNPFTGHGSGHLTEVNGAFVGLQGVYVDTALICLVTMIPLAAAGIFASLCHRRFASERRRRSL